MSTDELKQTLLENQSLLRSKGIKTLVLIGAGATTSPSSLAMEFLAELESPPSYEQLLEVRHCLFALLQHPVDVTLANPHDQAVQPFLDPEAIFII